MATEAAVRGFLNQIAPPDSLERGGSRGGRQDLLERGVELLRTAPGDGARFAAQAEAALDKVERGVVLAPVELEALEAMIIPAQRPVFTIVGDTYADTGKLGRPWQLDDADVRGLLERVIPHVGRLELPGNPFIPYGGTGFVVGPGLILTNRHVAELFVEGRGLSPALRLRRDQEPRVDFRAEDGGADPIQLEVVDVLLVHPYWDAAVLSVRGELGASRPGLELSMDEPESLVDHDIAVIGYPARPRLVDDPSRRKALDLVFGDVYDVKRLQPGILRDPVRERHQGHPAPTVTPTHDASTLAGNSGSVVVDLTTGQVIGLHFAGLYMKRNFAVSTRDLGSDPHLRDVGVAFSDAFTGPPPEWLRHWAPEHTGRTGPGRPSPVGRERPVDVDALAWFEQTTDAQLRLALRDDRSQTVDRLRQVLGDEETRELVDDLAPETEPEGLFAPVVNPHLPEIVFLHGLLGSHLRRGAGSGERVWFAPLGLLTRDLDQHLRLAADGHTDATPGLRLVADGHLRLAYGTAARRLRRQGFVVHEFSYDWRKPVDAAADALHHFIERIAAQRRDLRLVLVGHSMGGVVASVYAARHPTWDERVERAVVVGSPLGGAFDPIATVVGPYPLFTNLAWANGAVDEPDLRATAATLPGVLDLLPDPELFEGADAVYRTDRYPADARPSSRWLARSGNLKRTIRSSPLLGRTTAIVADRFETWDRVDVVDGRLELGAPSGAGDGTVPVKAAAIAGLEQVLRYDGNRPHHRLLTDARVIRAVADVLAIGGTEELPAYDGSAPEALTPLLPTGGVESADRSTAHDRLEDGTWDAHDVWWLFGQPVTSD